MIVLKVLSSLYGGFLVSFSWQDTPIQGCSQNLKGVPQNFKEVFNIDDVTTYDIIQRSQHWLLFMTWQKHCHSKIPVAWLWVYSQVSNRRGGRNKQRGWQISAKIIKGCKVNKRRSWNKWGGWQKHSN